MPLVISVEHLAKQYRLGAMGGATLREDVNRALARLRKRRGPGAEPRDDGSLAASGHDHWFWALRDVSFTVRQGEILGLIGHNGAGKSTLLKIISKITAPSKGRIRIRGRVGSLLEVGTGFHMELTGRENIFLNGAILGMKRAEIRAKLDEIIAFSEMSRFIDTPVKRYSSGMRVRLGFAVAAHLEPEILIVDEVLAVGDAAFQKKCIGKMRDVAGGGRTVIFVSHNMMSIARLCGRVIWLDQGKIRFDGSTREAIQAYLSKSSDASGTVWTPTVQTASRTGFSYSKVCLTTHDGAPVTGPLDASRPFNVEFHYQIQGHPVNGRITLKITSMEGIVVLVSSSADHAASDHELLPMGRHVLRCQVPAHLLAPGQYTLSITEPDANYREKRHDNILHFTVGQDMSLKAIDGREGVIMPLLQWEHTSAEPAHGG